MLPIVAMIMRTLRSKCLSQSPFRHLLASRFLEILLYVLLPFAVGILFWLDGDPTAAAAQPVVIIKMLDVPPVFQPARVTIKVGETVEWQKGGIEVPHR